MDEEQIDAVGLDLLLEALHRRYGYDFRSYSRRAIEHCTQNYLRRTGRSRVADLIPDVLYKRSVFEELVREYSVSVSTMFRNPHVFKRLTDDVFPWLRTHPHFRIWHAGCATGEEVYSLAILLKEAGLYERATIFATDFNDRTLQTAAQGVYEASRAREFTSNYLAAGGAESFSDYYTAMDGRIVMSRELRQRVTFANHNLTVDEVFSEVHLVLCRNVLIYFNDDLQRRSLRLFCESLVVGGHLCLGESESILFSEDTQGFASGYPSERIFIKRFSNGSPRPRDLKRRTRN